MVTYEELSTQIATLKAQRDVMQLDFFGKGYSGEAGYKRAQNENLTDRIPQYKLDEYWDLRSEITRLWKHRSRGYDSTGMTQAQVNLATIQKQGIAYEDMTSEQKRVSGLIPDVEVIPSASTQVNHEEIFRVEEQPQSMDDFPQGDLHFVYGEDSQEAISEGLSFLRVYSQTGDIVPEAIVEHYATTPEEQSYFRTVETMPDEIRKTITQATGLDIYKTQLGQTEFVEREVIPGTTIPSGDPRRTINVQKDNPNFETQSGVGQNGSELGDMSIDISMPEFKMPDYSGIFEGLQNLGKWIVVGILGVGVIMVMKK